MPIQKPIALYNEGESHQTHDVAKDGDTIDAAFIAIDGAAGNRISLVTQPAGGKALRVDLLSQTTDLAHDNHKNYMPGVDVHMMVAAGDSISGYTQTPLPSTNIFFSVGEEDSALLIPAYQKPKDKLNAITPKVSLASIIQEGNQSGATGDTLHQHTLSNDTWIDADVVFVRAAIGTGTVWESPYEASGMYATPHNVNTRTVLKGPIRASALPELARAAKGFTHLVYLSAADGSTLTLFWSPTPAYSRYREARTINDKSMFFKVASAYSPTKVHKVPDSLQANDIMVYQGVLDAHTSFTGGVTADTFYTQGSGKFFVLRVS